MKSTKKNSTINSHIEPSSMICHITSTCTNTSNRHLILKRCINIGINQNTITIHTRRNNGHIAIRQNLS